MPSKLGQTLQKSLLGQVTSSPSLWSLCFFDFSQLYKYRYQAINTFIKLSISIPEMLLSSDSSTLHSQVNNLFPSNFLPSFPSFLPFPSVLFFPPFLLGPSARYQLLADSRGRRVDAAPAAPRQQSRPQPQGRGWRRGPSAGGAAPGEPEVRSARGARAEERPRRAGVAARGPRSPGAVGGAAAVGGAGAGPFRRPRFRGSGDGARRSGGSARALQEPAPAGEQGRAERSRGGGGSWGKPGLGTAPRPGRAGPGRWEAGAACACSKGAGRGRRGTPGLARCLWSRGAPGGCPPSSGPRFRPESAVPGAAGARCCAASSGASVAIDGSGSGYVARCQLLVHGITYILRIAHLLTITCCFLNHVCCIR